MTSRKDREADCPITDEELRVKFLSVSEEDR
jgi:hypothetical protein